MSQDTVQELPPEIQQEVDRQVAALCGGVIDLHTEADLRSKLARSLQENRPLRIKLGADPTAPDIHLGHAVVLTKLRQFQELGHRVIFLIGDFTARIGDPSGKKEMRPMLDEAAIAENANTYTKQVFKILNPDQTEIRFNSEWMGKLNAAGVVSLAANMTVARMLERDDFEKRYTEGRPIGIHEFLYPLVQGYDSVALEADVEIGGSDQLFNLLVGRELQKSHGQEPQVVMTVPLLEGIDARFENGKIVGAKMSKSLGNYVGIEEAPEAQFGKLMSISDPLMWRYYRLLSGKSSTEIDAMQKGVEEETIHPMAAKKGLAHLLVQRFHSPEAADRAQQDFETRFSKREIPTDLPEFEIEATVDDGAGLIHILREAKLASSGKEARRSCQQGAVRIEGEKITDPNYVLTPGSQVVVQVGRRKMARITVIAKS
ncbi:MAG: tyrosine--tRNA ligase [Myxococcales bacterium]|nr:tyrosine--tRNA ligase [Myxococcales bacterium]|tara:strand:- start:223 stop:1512 length:1290 start_codon:yes stop_codon:yes gene_type:complete